MTQNMKNTIKSLLNIKGGKVAKQEKSCLCGHCCFPEPVESIPVKKSNLTSIKGGKGKTSTVQTVNVQKMIEDNTSIILRDVIKPTTNTCHCR